MADFEPPSFSLGLDLDSQLRPSPSNSSPPANDALDELERAQVDDSDVESDAEPPAESTRVFKRLRRGPGLGPGPSTVESSSSMKNREEIERVWGDDEIEEFSSPEDSIPRGTGEPLSTQFRSVCSSSKVPLQGHAILTTRSTGQLKARKKEQSAGVPSASLPTRQNEFVFPKLTISPLRKFQLLDSDSDSDSDHPPVSKDVNETAHIPDAVLKESKSVASQEKREAPSLVHQDDDLWKDFCPINNFRIATPALDEVCEEYFSSRKKQGDGSQKLQTNPCLDNNRNSFPKMTHMSLEQNWDSSNPLPPAHHYFLHKDPRIQNLVHSRLPNFLPIGVALDRSNQQPGSSAMNYTSQFINGETSKRKGAQSNNGKSSTRGRKKSKRSNTEDVANTSEGWIDPRSSENIPKDAGKRRVHASGQSSGHWYTSPEGKKVYVSKNGQELMGQLAYRQYRKDTGSFRKSKKKTGGKKKKTKT